MEEKLKEIKDELLSNSELLSQLTDNMNAITFEITELKKMIVELRNNS